MALFTEGEANNPEEFEALVRKASPNQVISILDVGTHEIENWYQEEIHEFINQVSSHYEVDPDPWFYEGNLGWLHQEIEPHVLNLGNAVAEYQNIAMIAVNHWRDNSGIGGFVMNFAKGFMDPIDGLLALVDRSSSDIERKQYTQAHDNAFETVVAMLESVQRGIDIAVVKRWNEAVDRIPREIEYAANHREGGLTPKVLNEPHNQDDNDWILGCLIILIIAALPIGGFGWWYWNHSQLQLNSAQTVTEILLIPPGSELRKGPGGNYEVLATLKSADQATVLDRSVPGWIKVSTSFGATGWLQQK